jgi:Protein of unknown function (DUF2474)
MATIETASPPQNATPLWKRLGWLILIWSASVATMFVLSWLLRLWLKP